MGLVETANRYHDFGVTASAYFFSKPPPFSEELRKLNKVGIKRVERSLGTMLFPAEPYINQILRVARGGVQGNWYTLSDLKGKPPDLFKLVDVMIPFADDTSNNLSEYYCKPKIEETMKRIVRSNDPVLDMQTQLKIIQPNPNNIWEKLYNLALALRVFARNRDTRIGLNADLKTSISVLEKLPVFPELDVCSPSNYHKNIATNAGEWYHFLSTIVLGAAFEHHKKEVDTNSLLYKLKFWGFEMIFTKTGELAKIIRPKANKCGFHEYSDLAGFNTGRSLAIILDNNSLDKQVSNYL